MEGNHNQLRFSRMVRCGLYVRYRVKNALKKLVSGEYLEYFITDVCYYSSKQGKIQEKHLHLSVPVVPIASLHFSVSDQAA